MSQALPDPLRLAERQREQCRRPAPPAFEDLTTIQQLDAIEIACRRSFYAAARAEALPESDEYAQLLEAMADSCITDSEIGRRAREILIAYMARVAELRGDELGVFAR